VRRAAALAWLFLAASGASLFAQSFNTEAEARFNVGLQHIREGRYDLAIDTIKQAIKSDPKNAFFYTGLGTAYQAKKKYAEAIEAYRKALEINPFYVDVKNHLGTAYILSGKRDEGKKEFIALFSDPTNPTPEITARNLGQAYLEEKNYAEALNWFRTSITRSKNYVDPYLGSADAFLGMGRLEDAIQTLEAGCKDMPDDPQLNLALGQAYFQAGRFSEARQKLEAASRREPNGPAGRQAAELLKNFPK
jgi:Tfp pilus assembly protein PilF